MIVNPSEMVGQLHSPVVDAPETRRIPITDEYGIKFDYQAPEHLRENSLCSSLSHKDKTSFLQRAHTYTSFKWNSSRFSPYFCALFGWECIRKNVLKCSCCQNQINLFCNENPNPELMALQLKRFEEKLKTDGHKNDCTWILNPCPESFSCLPTISVELQNEFLENLKSFNVTKNNMFCLPCLSEDSRKQLGEEISKKQNFQPTDAVLFASSGWKLRDTRRSVLTCQNDALPFQSEFFRLECKYCNRSAPVKNYLMKQHPFIIPPVVVIQSKVEEEDLLSQNNSSAAEVDLNEESNNKRKKIKIKSISSPQSADSSSKSSSSTVVLRSISRLSIDQPPPSFGQNINRCFGLSLGPPIVIEKKNDLFFDSDDECENEVDVIKTGKLYPSALKRKLDEDEPKIVESTRKRRKKTHNSKNMENKTEVINEATNITTDSSTKIGDNESNNNIIGGVGKKRKRSSSGGNSEFSSQFKKRARLEAKKDEGFHALKEHRSCCPWVVKNSYPNHKEKISGHFFSLQTLNLDPSYLVSMMSSKKKM